MEKELKAMGIEPSEIKSWNTLSYDEKVWAVRILKENGYESAVEAVFGMLFSPETASFGRFWLLVTTADISDMQSYY